MNNKAMEQKLNSGAAMDLSRYPQNDEGDRVLPPNIDIEDIDLCIKDTEEWIYSVGRNLATGEIVASTRAKFYRNPDFRCLWLR